MDNIIAVILVIIIIFKLIKDRKSIIKFMHENNSPDENSRIKPKDKPINQPNETPVQDDTFYKNLCRIVEELLQTFPLKPAINDSLIKKHFDDRNFALCKSEIQKKMGIECQVKLISYEDDKFPGRERTNGFVTIPNNIPLIATEQFRNFRFEITIKKSTKIKYETFVYTLAHEMSHILLHSIKHRLKDSEEATDILPMLLGFSNIMKNGIIIENKIGDIMEDGISRRETHETIFNGYLGNKKNFERLNTYISNKLYKE
jgi:hypothetical protein